MYKILIADSSDIAAKCWKRVLEREFLVRLCKEEQILKLVNQWRPEVLLLDLHLAGNGGLEVFRQLWQLPYRPMVIATSHYADAGVNRYSYDCEVDFLLCKPFTSSKLLGHIRELLQFGNLQSQYPVYSDHDIAKHLKRLGLQAHLDGSKYLCEALRQLAHNPDQRYTKELYPAVGSVFGVSGERVERCVRDAIHKAWLRRDDEIWRQYFPPDGKGNIAKPKNAEFIANLMQELRFAA